MERLFVEFIFGSAKLANHFLFPSIMLGCGNPDGVIWEGGSQA